MTTAIIVAVALLAVAACLFLVLFNRLVRLRNKVDNAWHQIDVELKRRYDLLPELAEVVRGYASHEKEVLESAARARTAAMNANGPGERGPAEDDLTGAVGGLFGVAEQYTDLKANLGFRDLQHRLITTENRIAGSRKYYNGAVMYYENARRGFPGNIVAGAFPGRFGARQYFEIVEPEARQVPGA